ncbi:MAG: prolipoprotein diacylglyceryl transferase [Alistipes sp.]|nr:prolipoprotein diacylglyceryl transferase [Alistipes sp.]
MIHELVVVWDFNPVFFSIGSFEVRYYGLMWAVALLLGGWMFNTFCKKEGLRQEIADSIFIYGTLATVIGARVGHCLFYEPAYYLAQPWAIITEIRNGGMASHGAAVGLLIGLWLFSRKNKLPYIWSLDRVMIPVAIGGAIVRLGNLFNSEIVGCATDVSWGFKFLRLYPGLPVADVPVQHPTQLYEAVCYIITFVILAYMYYAKDWGRKRPGLLFGVGLEGIFLTRFLIEFIKVEQEEFEKGMLLDMGQILSIPFILLGFYMIYRAFSRPEQMPTAADSRTASAASADKPRKKKTTKKW